MCFFPVSFILLAPSVHSLVMTVGKVAELNKCFSLLVDCWLDLSFCPDLAFWGSLPADCQASLDNLFIWPGCFRNFSLLLVAVHLHHLFLVATPRNLPFAHDIQDVMLALAYLHSPYIVRVCGVGL